MQNRIRPSNNNRKQQQNKIENELLQLRLNRSVSQEKTKLKDAAPFDNPETVHKALEAERIKMKQHSINLLKITNINDNSVTSPPTSQNIIDLQNEWHLQQRLQKEVDTRKKREAALQNQKYNTTDAAVVLSQLYVHPSATTTAISRTSQEASPLEETRNLFVQEDIISFNDTRSSFSQEVLLDRSKKECDDHKLSCSKNKENNNSYIKKSHRTISNQIFNKSKASYCEDGGNDKVNRVQNRNNNNFSSEVISHQTPYKSIPIMDPIQTPIICDDIEEKGGEKDNACEKNSRSISKQVFNKNTTTTAPSCDTRTSEEDKLSSIRTHSKSKSISQKRVDQISRMSMEKMYPQHNSRTSDENDSDELISLKTSEKNNSQKALSHNKCGDGITLMNLLSTQRVDDGILNRRCNNNVPTMDSPEQKLRLSPIDRKSHSSEDTSVLQQHQSPAEGKKEWSGINDTIRGEGNLTAKCIENYQRGSSTILQYNYDQASDEASDSNRPVFGMASSSPIKYCNRRGKSKIDETQNKNGLCFDALDTNRIKSNIMTWSLVSARDRWHRRSQRYRVREEHSRANLRFSYMPCATSAATAIINNAGYDSPLSHDDIQIDDETSFVLSAKGLSQQSRCNRRSFLKFESLLLSNQNKDFIQSKMTSISVLDQFLGEQGEEIEILDQEIERSCNENCEIYIPELESCQAQMQCLIEKIASLTTPLSVAKANEDIVKVHSHNNLLIRDCKIAKLTNDIGAIKATIKELERSRDDAIGQLLAKKKTKEDDQHQSSNEDEAKNRIRVDRHSWKAASFLE